LESGHSGNLSAERLKKTPMVEFQPYEVVLHIGFGDMSLQCGWQWGQPGEGVTG
jgi:hypothetical protein